MIKALFYKEWIKTRWAVLLLIILFAGFIAYTFVEIAQMFRVNRPEAIWDNIILKDILLIPNIQWLPLIAGVLLAVTQHIPEMVNKRFKLTLHLPMPDNRIVIWMLLYGFFILLLLYAAAFTALLLGLAVYFPKEFIVSAIQMSLPWFMGGFTAYALSVWIIYEPVWKFRVSEILITACTLMLFYFDGKSGAYLPFMPYLGIIMAISILFPFYSVGRFKEGAQ